MKSATVRDLRIHCTRLLTWVAAGEEVLVTQRGKPIARLIPESSAPADKVDWSQSAAVKRDRSCEQVVEAAESAQLLAAAGERW